VNNYWQIMSSEWSQKAIYILQYAAIGTK